MTITTAEITTRAAVTRTLPDDLLERCRLRAGRLDHDNEYFHEDLEELRGIGYLAAAVPVHHGGWGLDLAELAQEQRRLARHAPATALAISMHTYWTGIAAELERAGDPSLTWILQAAAAGDVFVAGHAEAGNDVPVLLSTCAAERVAGAPLDRPQAVRVQWPGVALARRPRHRRGRRGWAAASCTPSSSAPAPA